jgi:hypothetical protein
MRSQRGPPGIDALIPLSIWAGNTCCVCGKPTNGVVDQETAVKLLERTGHKECLINGGRRRRRHFFDLTGGDKTLRTNIMADVPKPPTAILIVPEVPDLPPQPFESPWVLSRLPRGARPPVWRNSSRFIRRAVPGDSYPKRKIHH